MPSGDLPQFIFWNLTVYFKCFQPVRILVLPRVPMVWRSGESFLTVLNSNVNKKPVLWLHFCAVFSLNFPGSFIDMLVNGKWVIFLPDVRISKVFNSSLFLQEDARDLDAYTLAKSYFDLKEYDRAAYFLRGCKSQKAYFLYMYSRYLVR